MDLNGIVALSDFTGFVNNFGQVGGWYTGNFNNPNGGPDGTNDIAWLEDYNTIVNNFGRSTPGAGGIGVVPEPMGAALLSIAFAIGFACSARVRVGRN